MEYNTVEVLKAISDPIRLSIVKKLYSRDELCACDLLDDYKITQPTLSFHMKKLVQCGLVTSKKDGTWVRYKVNSEFYNHLITELMNVQIDVSKPCTDETCCTNK